MLLQQYTSNEVLKMRKDFSRKEFVVLVQLSQPINQVVIVSVTDVKSAEGVCLPEKLHLRSVLFCRVSCSHCN